MIHVSTADELQDVLRSNRYVLVAFTAPSWCIPCQRLEPHFEGAADVVASVTFVKVDVDTADPGMIGSHEVLGVPTLILFEDEVEKRRLTARTTLKIVAELNGEPGV